MFNSAQRISTISTLGSNAQRRLTVTKDDKIKVKKLDLYYEDRTLLKD